MNKRICIRTYISQTAIVVAEFFGTCLWFSATAVSPEIAESLGKGSAEPLDLSSAVQVGFVVGTLLIGLTGLADRFRASHIFAVSALLGAVANAAIGTFPIGFDEILLCRFVTGLALAGIYPIGMKLVVGWNPASAGRVLSLLVAMLTLGTAFPHLIRYLDAGSEWHLSIIAASLLAGIGGLIVLATGDGPAARWGRPCKLDLAAALYEFRRRELGGAALGYLGHMWELYACWSLVPLLAAAAMTQGPHRTNSLAAFLIISAGALGCIIGGFISKRTGSRAVALAALVGSAGACALVPLIQNPPLLLFALFLWGLFVIPDSPQLSSLAVAACKDDQVASTLALLNGTGFLLTVGSIKLSLAFWPSMGSAVTWLLLPGPILGFASVMLLSSNRAPESQDSHGGVHR